MVSRPDLHPAIAICLCTSLMSKNIVLVTTNCVRVDQSILGWVESAVGTGAGTDLDGFGALRRRCIA